MGEGSGLGVAGRTLTLQMTQKPSILNCNNNINCIISPAANVNAAATAAIKTQLATADDDDIADIPITSSRAKSQSLTAKSYSDPITKYPLGRIF
jgi:hypothetical protein